MPRRVSYATTAAAPHPVGFSPVMESVDQAIQDTAGNLQLPETMTTDDFTRAVAVATVSALRHQQQTAAHSPARVLARASGGMGAESEAGGHGGHDAPSWSRTTSASVLLACTALYALIAGLGHLVFRVYDDADSFPAEILVEVVDAILDGSGIDEKFLGVTIFALVPNTTEFMNAISFALNGNIALRFILAYHTLCFVLMRSSCTVWKLAPHMHCKSVSFRFRPWLLSLRGMLRKRWAK